MKTLANLALSNNKSNKTRSILIILSVTLTTLLLMVIATFGYGIVKSNKSNAGSLYGSYYGSFLGVSEKQLYEMKLRSEFKEIGKTAYVGEVDNDMDINLYSTDEMSRKLMNFDQNLEEGQFPIKIDEIVGDKAFFEKSGYPEVEVGDHIFVQFRPDLESQYESIEFIVSGILKDSDSKNTLAGYTSEEFYNQWNESNSRYYNAYFNLDESVSINSDTAEEVLKDLADNCGIDPDKVAVNTLYIMWALDPGIEIIVVCIGISILVIIFSVVVIYNIFQVGITQKIWEYGKIKALGANKKQLKSIIFKEGMYLAVIGIPIGEFIGFIIAKVTVQWIINKSEVINKIHMERISLVSLPIILIVTFFSLCTVWLALKRPMKIVSSVSIVDAMRYQENTGKKRSIRRGKDKVNVKSLMLANLASNRRRTYSTILTMGLSCVLFVVMSNFVGNMDEKYDARRAVEKGEFFICLDYSMNDKAYPENNLENILKNNPLNQETVEKIRELEGVTNVYTRKILIIDTKENGPMTVSVLNKEDFNRLSEGSKLGVLDYDKASKENAILFGWSHFIEDYGYTINQIVNAKVEEGKEIDAPLLGSFESLDTDWAITEDTYKAWNIEREHIGYVWVDCDQKDNVSVEKELDDLLLGLGHIEKSSYEEALQSSRTGMQLMKLCGYALLAIIGLIGFMNMANTMITSIIIRKQEFGVLQAIGMSNKQLNRMLQAEGLIFTIGTVIVSLIVGIPLGYGAFLYGKNNGWIGLHEYHFPVIEVLLMIVVILGLQGLLSFILSRNIKKESLVERIRYQG